MNLNILRTIACTTVAITANFMPAAHATTVDYAFTGTILEITPLIGDGDVLTAAIAEYGIVLGATAGGAYTLDTQGTDLNSAANVGRYSDATPRVSYFFGDLAVDTAPGGNADGSTSVDISDGSGIGDYWNLTSVLDFDEPGFITSIFEVYLLQDDGGVLSGDGLDQTLPALDAFDPFGPAAPFATSVGTVLRFEGGSAIYVRAELNSYAVVPVPAAVWLLVGGLLSLSGLRGRRV